MSVQNLVWISIILMFILGAGFGFWYSQKSNAIETNQLATSQPQITSQPSATPQLFADLTIPYLRQQKFSSQLAELKSYNKSGNYSSFLTSYQSDNLKINGLITKPNGEMPAGGWPAIVFVHGYIPPTQYQTTTRYNDYVDYLARNGFVVFKIDLRGHGDSEGEPGGAYYSSDYIIDTLNARAALQSSDFINPSKIGLWGHSMAGNVVMRSLAAQPDIPAIVIWAGAVYTYQDFSDYGISDNSFQPGPSDSNRTRRRQQLREIYGEPKDGNEFWKLVAPTNYLSDINGAIQIHHSSDDDVVGVEYSRNLNQLLDKTQIDHQYFEYNSGGHNLTGSSFTSAMQRTVEFYKQKLK